MLDQILFFNIDISAKFLSGSQLKLGDVMHIFRIVTKFRKTSMGVLSHQLQNARTFPPVLMQLLILNAL